MASADPNPGPPTPPAGRALPRRPPRPGSVRTALIPGRAPAGPPARPGPPRARGRPGAGVDRPRPGERRGADGVGRLLAAGRRPGRGPGGVRPGRGAAAARPGQVPGLVRGTDALTEGGTGGGGSAVRTVGAGFATWGP